MQIVYIPGVWDLLHAGHINVLSMAKALGDTLVVGVASDSVVEQDKKFRPAIPLEQRLIMLRAVRYVDLALPYHELSFMEHLRTINPDIIAVGQYWGADKRHKDLEEWVDQYGARLVKLPYTGWVSTSSIKKSIINPAPRGGS